MAIFHYLIRQLPRDVEMPSAAEYSLIKPAHNFQSIAEIPTRFRFAQSVTHCPVCLFNHPLLDCLFNFLNGMHDLNGLPGQCQVVFVVLHGFCVLSQIEIGISELGVDGTQSPQVIRPCLDGRFKEGDASSAWHRMKYGNETSCRTAIICTKLDSVPAISSLAQPLAF